MVSLSDKVSWNLTTAYVAALTLDTFNHADGASDVAVNANLVTVPCLSRLIKDKQRIRR